MKLTTFLLLINFAGFAASGYSQTEKVTIRLRDASMKDFFNEVEKQTSYKFLYRDDAVENIHVTLDEEYMPLDQVLHQALDGSKFSYKILENNLVVIAPENILQQIAVSGIITDGNSGEPLAGVNITIRGTTTGVISGMDGKYAITVTDPNATLIFSFIGYGKQEIALGGKTSVNVALMPETKNLDDVIVVGYGSTTKRATTASISTISSEKLTIPVPTLGDAIGGKVNGVFVNSAGGGPGKKPQITIRGGSTPLVVIDGIVSSMADFQNLNPNDIENFSVLKDAQAAAVYGARAGNGIIAITTKKGVAGTMKINYDYSLTLSQPTILPRKLDSYQTVMRANEARKNDEQAPAYSDDVVQKYLDQSDPFNYPNTDWYKLVLNTFAPSQRHNFSVSGGTDKTKYYASLSYLDQGSLYVFSTDWLKRYNYKLSLTNNFDKIGLQVNVDLYGTTEKRREPFSAYGGAVQVPGTSLNVLAATGSFWGHLVGASPTQLAYTDLGLYSQMPQHPLVEIDPRSGYNLTQTNYLNGILNLEWSVPGVKGLVIKAINQYRLDNNWFKSWMATAPQYPLQSKIPIPITAPNLIVYSGQGYSYTNQFLGEYKKVFANDHNVNVLFGYERSYGYNEYVNATRLSYILIRDQLSAGPTINMSNGSSAAENARAGFVGRLGYNYKSKYFLEGSFRRDGSDWFPPDKRWGTFWSGSAGWIVSSENFMKNLDGRNIIDFLKLRASYGVVGLDGSDAGISRYQYLQGYSVDQMGYLINNLFVPTFSEGPLVSPDLTWYTQKSTNVGIDFATANSRISGSFDYFFMETTGMLASPSSTIYADPLGTALPTLQTNGNLRRAGFEITLAYKNNISDLQYTIGGNLSRYLQMWKNNPYEDISVLKNPYTRTTYETDYYGIGYKSLGYFTSADDVLNSPKIPTTTRIVPGDIKYNDLNGDGRIDVNDQEHIGNDNTPRIMFGVTLDLQYKAWFLSSLVQGAAHRDMYAGTIPQLDYWTPTNTNATFPRLMSNDSYNGNNNSQRSDFWLASGRYVRLKLLQIGYDFKKTLFKNMAGVSECSLIIGGTNLLTASPVLRKFELDPEAGPYGTPPVYNNTDYPVERTFFSTIRIGF